MEQEISSDAIESSSSSESFEFMVEADIYSCSRMSRLLTPPSYCIMESNSSNTNTARTRCTVVSTCGAAESSVLFGQALRIKGGQGAAAATAAALRYWYGE